MLSEVLCVHPKRDGPNVGKKVKPTKQTHFFAPLVQGIAGAGLSNKGCWTAPPAVAIIGTAICSTHATATISSLLLFLVFEQTF